MDGEAGMREAGPTSGDAALVEAARSAPAAFYQFRVSPSGIYAIPFASPDFAARLGIELGEPEETAARFFSRVHPDDLAPIADAIMRSARTFETFESEFRFRLPSGAEGWIEARSNPVRTADGVIWNGIVTDITARKTAEAALRQSEKQFRAVLENLQDAYFRTDLDGRFVMLSPSSTGMYRYASTQELIGQPSRVLFADSEERDRVIAEIREKGFVRDRIGLGRRKDGSTLWTSLNAQPWFDEEGRPAGMEGVARDISARMDAEAALRESEERFRLFIHHASVAIAMFDRDMRYVAASRRWLSDYGLGDRNLTGLSHYEVFPEIPERWKEAHRRCLAGDVVRAEEDRFERADGSVQWLRWEIRPWRTDDQDVGGIVMFTEDITERKRASEALAASEARYRVLFENAAEGIIAIDPDTKRFQFFNPALCAMFGYAPDEFGRLTLADIHPKEALEGVLGAFRKLASGTPLVSSSMPCLRKDGTAFLADIRASLIEIAGRMVVFGFFTDVTARVRLEEQLLQSQKMEAVGQLAGGVAHDFNNLLTVISGNCDLLLSDTSADDPKRGPLADIRTAGERAANLTRQLLAFSRKQILEPRLVDVHEIVTGIEKMLRRIIGEDVELLTDLAADLSWVKVDAGQLEQVVMNLAVNARDAMPRGGRIAIRTRNVDPSDSVVLEESAGRQLRPRVAISISDTGTGLAPEVKAHLFEPFFTTKGVGKGTGLGLATVFGIVKQSGGDITVESEPGKGATFTVILPSQPAPRRPGGSGASLRAVPRGTETVLVVEDEDAVRRIVKIALESAGYRMIEARNGPEALEAARTHSGEIHLVVTDVVMPEMSGRELAERIVKEHAGVRILYVSGYMDDAVMRHGITDSGVAFLQKPFSPLALARKVREVLDGKGV